MTREGETLTSSASNPSSPEEIEEILELIEDDPQLDLLNLLGTIPFLPPSEVRRLEEKAVFRRFPPGAVVFREGERGEEWGIVIRGEAEVRATYGGKEVVVGRVGAGEIVGEVAVFHHVPRTSTIVAREPLDLCLFPGDLLIELSTKYGEFRIFLEKIIHERAEGTIRALEASTPS